MKNTNGEVIKLGFHPFQWMLLVWENPKFLSHKLSKRKVLRNFRGWVHYRRIMNRYAYCYRRELYEGAKKEVLAAKTPEDVRQAYKRFSEKRAEVREYLWILRRGYNVTFCRNVDPLVYHEIIRIIETEQEQKQEQPVCD